MTSAPTSTSGPQTCVRRKKITKAMDFPHFLILLSKPMICQDRLGTNVNAAVLTSVCFAAHHCGRLRADGPFSQLRLAGERETLTSPRPFCAHFLIMKTPDSLPRQAQDHCNFKLKQEARRALVG